ncbi:XRE family transcriptional regulator [Streptomyces sp. ODS05-4]|uniref:XRE family transcriptional regulator n=1 Tax=Streptomyces sp. ODS05-4 TaxID=2944939 RepID=UPI00210C308D|nr:XRE family transcriptional regulator [Streptomyces sp. ODS05-4]
MARESVELGPRTQAGMAEALGVDLGTWQGWESGRRPLANVKVGSLMELRRRLLTMGGDSLVIGLLDAAMDADRIVSATIEPEATRHPLADWVHTRDTAHMIAWALNGTTPPLLAARGPKARRGPSASAPLLSAQDRNSFFTRLREAADAAAICDEDGTLLHRQALYLNSYDRSAESASWTMHALRSRPGLLGARGWTPGWAAARSTAAALARLGDPQPLQDFIDRALADDEMAERANLNYWAYWTGAIREPQANDHFMHGRGNRWEPQRLLRGLVDGLHQAPSYTDLYVHSLWALITTHPWLPLAAPDLSQRLEQQTAALLDFDGGTTRIRRELSTVHYVLREMNK